MAALDWIECLCGGKEAFEKPFGLILADRGSEFDDIAGIEKGGPLQRLLHGPAAPRPEGRIKGVGNHPSALFFASDA